MKALLYFSMLFVKLSFFPNANLLLWMGITIALDFLTGISKAYVLKQARTSSGFRKTILKFLQYGGSIAVGIVLANTAKENNLDGTHHVLSLFNDGLVVFIIYIEVTSIFENLYACDKTTVFSKYIITPALKILTAQIKNNPLMKEAENLKEK